MPRGFTVVAPRGTASRTAPVAGSTTSRLPSPELETNRRPACAATFSRSSPARTYSVPASSGSGSAVTLLESAFAAKTVSPRRARETGPSPAGRTGPSQARSGLTVRTSSVAKQATARVRHVPASQDSPAPQGAPHAPQFQRSEARSAQARPHVSSPLAQAAAHAAALHTCAGAQAVPHAPQCAGSVARSTHPPPHSVLPGGHAHAPSWQAPLEQAKPHAPQFAASLARAAQRPPQAVSPTG